MSWDFSDELNHLNHEILHTLLMLGAIEAKMTTPPEKLFAAKETGNDFDGFIEVWFIASSPTDNKDFIGVILMNADVERKKELPPDARVVIHDDYFDKMYSLSEQLVQFWGTKVMEESMRPNYYGCPIEYLDKVPPRSAQDREWRENVLRRRVEGAEQPCPRFIWKRFVNYTSI